MNPIRPYLILLALLMAPPAPALPGIPAHEYRPGRGLQWPNAHLTLGGYLSLRYRHLDGEQARLNLRDVSLFGTWSPAPRWRLFTELEIGEAVTLRSDEATTRDAEFDVERLYLDFQAHPSLSVRVGKSLTPVGQWNRIHAAPLVWTVSRPLVTSVPFARHTSGVSLQGSRPWPDGGSLSYVLYLDDSQVLDPDRSEATFEGGTREGPPNGFRRGVGGHLQYATPGQSLALGVSLGHFLMRGLDEWKDLLGVDLRWRHAGLELHSEAVYRYSAGGHEPDEHGVFLQGVVPLRGHWLGVLRYEDFRGSEPAVDAGIGSLGLAYRPQRGMVWKLEYRNGDGNRGVAPDGLLASFALLF